jgi:5-methylcytosine-specific restriction endonuclease McrBC regulatory subunit McrC
MAESDDLRVFIRDLMTRFDKKTAAWEVAERKRHEAVMEQFRKSQERDEELYAESRAQRSALFRMLDRLDGRGDTPPA